MDQDDWIRLIQSTNGDANTVEVRELERKRLIISSGDISDVDGFFALAEYCKTGADCVFVMNYPAFLNPVYRSHGAVSRLRDGLGFTYDVLKLIRDNSAAYETWYKSRYNNTFSFYEENIKQSYTDIAFQICKSVWNNTNTVFRGKLFFYVGGYNTINPFSDSSVKKEITEWFSYVKTDEVKLNSLEGSFYDMDRKEISFSDFVQSYSDIYMDFNGSAAFFNNVFIEKLKLARPRAIKSLFFMGGCLSYEIPSTMVATETLNRFSASTMNQFYHPKNTQKLMDFCKSFGIQIYVVSNNMVPAMLSKEAIIQFLQHRGIDSTTCMELANHYYGNNADIGSLRPQPPKKLFDLYNAMVMTSIMQRQSITVEEHNLYLIHRYAYCLVSRHATVNDAVNEYFDKIRARFPDPSDLISSSISKEISSIQDIIQSESNYSTYSVYNVTFNAPTDGSQFTFESQCPWLALERLAAIVSSVL